MPMNLVLAAWSEWIAIWIALYLLLVVVLLLAMRRLPRDDE